MRHWLLLLAPLALAACRDAPVAPAPYEVLALSADSAAVRVTYHGTPVELSVATTASSIAAGDTAIITMAVRNPSARPITLTFGSSCQLLPGIRDRRDGREILWWGCLAVITSLTLDAGETKRQAYVFTGETHEYEPGVGSFMKPLPPGPYEAYAQLGESPGVRSPAVPIEVVAR